jgi:V8-like Glu-specific endopeptidase
MQIHRRFEKTSPHLAYSYALAAFLLTTLAGQPRALAADVVVHEVVEANSTEGYWTAARLQSAQPLPLPKVSHIPTAANDEVAPLGDQAVETPGRKPSTKAAPDPSHKLFEPGPAPQLEDKAGVSPEDVGTAGGHFTSARPDPLSADQVYPFRTVGKLFFTQPGVGNFVCSASAISFRIVVTAGHCVHSGNGQQSGFFTNFLFVPAFRDGAAPFGQWSVNRVVVTATWFNGGGVVPNAADYATLDTNDRVINGVATRIGTATGFLGTQTLSLFPNHVTMLGYPCNLDACQKLHRVDAGSLRTQAPNCAEYGSDARGGSSGGPWAQNFGTAAAAAAGSVPGLNSGRNRVVGVTSYGPIDQNPKFQGASIFDTRFNDGAGGGVFGVACGLRAGNCTP